MFKRILALALCFLALPAMGQSPQLAANELLPNLLINYNPGFENGLQRWTKAGSSTFTQTTTAANVAFGNAAASWTPGAANDTLTSTQVTVPAGLFARQCMGSAWIKASDGVTTFQVINGSSTVQASTVLASSSTYLRYQVAFTCPSSGTLAVQLKSSGSGAAVLMDQVYLGATLEMPVIDLAQTTTPGTPASGKLRVYGKSDNNLYFLNSSGTEQQVGSGSGQKNYIQTGSNTNAGWTSSANGNLTVTTDTTTADLPRPQTTKTGIKFTGVSGSTAFAYYDFQLDPADYGVKLGLWFSQACGLAGGATSSCAASDFRLDVYSCTVAWSSGTCGGTSARLPLSTDTSSVTALPLFTGGFPYPPTFDAPGSSAPYLQLQVGLNTTQTHSVVLSDIVVGPGQIQRSAAVSPETSWTTTVTGGGTVTGLVATYHQVGNRINGFVSFTTGTPSGVLASITLPNSWTSNNSISGNNGQVGTYNRNNDSASAAKTGLVITGSSNSNLLFFSISDYTTAASPLTAQNGNAIWQSSQYVELTFELPINELAGQGVVNVQTNTPTYYYGTGGTWGTSSTLTTAIGQGGVLGGTTTPTGSNFVYTIVPTYPVPSGVAPALQASPDGIHWGPIPNASVPLIIDALRFDGTNYIGGGASLNSSGNIEVRFGKYSSGTSSAWTGTWYWRVVVGMPAETSGFAGATTTAAGLVSYEDSGPVSINFKGNSSANASGAQTIYYDRVGKKVTLTFPGITITASGSDTHLVGQSALPSGLWPAVTHYQPCGTNVNGAALNTPGAMSIDTSGNINIYKDFAQTGACTNAQTCGLYGGYSISYRVP